MRQVFPLSIWIGSAVEVDNLDTIFEAGITALVDLAMNEKPAQLTRELIYCRFPLVDGHGNSPQLLRAAVRSVESMMCEELPTLVFCSAGMSRSVAVLAMALARTRGDSPQQALTKLISGQPHDVSPLLWEDVCNAFD